MNKIKIAKRVTSLVVGMGTAKVVKEIIKNNTAIEKPVDKAAIMIAGYVLGAIAADATKVWTDDKIEEIVNWWTENVLANLNRK